MKLKDFKGITKTHETKFISAENVYGDYYEIRLEKPEGLKWDSGKHAIFSLPNNKIEGKKWRAFSIASTPKENVILLGTRTGESISSFKKELVNMNAGEAVKVRGPFGWFTLKDNITPLVLISLGVGVTPVRSLLIKLEHQHDREVNVIYSSSDFYMFKERIEKVINHNHSFKIEYTKSIEDTKQAINNQAKNYGNNAQYYISGPIKAIKSVQSQLKELGIKQDRIVKDPFLGY
ncbi:FAD-dependent oxidoreductase [Candidatus Izimaplasma bacterium]|nr:FAD-dependent oxidoreductase [Candidatus Izimaplasma bacterium]